MTTFHTGAIHTSTVYDGGYVVPEEVDVHLWSDAGRRVIASFGRGVSTGNRVDAHPLGSTTPLDGPDASAAISAALLAIRNHHSGIDNPVTLIDCPRCDGQGDLADVENGRPCPLCAGNSKCSPDDATDWINATLAAATASWGTTAREQVPA